jgi:hypothetical protein
MLAVLATNVELLMLALDVLVDEQLVSSTGAGEALLVVALAFPLIVPFINFRAKQHLRLARYRPLVEF